MSKIGRQPVVIPENIKVNISENSQGQQVSISNPKGEVCVILPKKIVAKIEEGKIILKAQVADKKTKSLHGLYRNLIKNYLEGLEKGFEKKLEILGTGYRAKADGQKLILNVGYSHSVEIEAPQGISFSVNKNIISVTGFDKQKVGQMAAEIRKVKPPEPYKGKGIKYLEETIIRKPGKRAVATTL